MMKKLGVSVALFGALALSPGTSAAAPHKGLADCRGKLQVKPASVVLSCADGNFGFTHLTWVTWGGARAVALGSAFANDCKPYCAAGHFHNYRGVLIVTGSERCPHDTEAYSTVTYAFIGRSPFPNGSLATQPRPCGSLP